MVDLGAVVCSLDDADGEGPTTADRWISVGGDASFDGEQRAGVHSHHRHSLGGDDIGPCRRPQPGPAPALDHHLVCFHVPT
jgi:hypothetical protein